ncbi:putative mitochondrial protein AtMg00310 [Apium graveolens]|uniref:putative mitochondrial protein AtMg00310 n=1 Tax=Apium graveolens TaxID=4045 RepID=UPI003D7A2A7D
MLAKQAWRLVNKCNPVVRALMKAIYYPHSEFLNATIGINPSYIWRSIMEAQEVIRQGSRKRIGDGHGTLVWQDPWLPCEHNGFMTTERNPQLEHVTVANLMTED